MTSLRFTVPKSLWMSANRQIARPGHRQRIISDLHVLAALGARQAGVRRLPEPCTIVWEICYPKGTGPKADPPNAYPTSKALLDGLVNAGLLTDDNANVVVVQAFCRGPNTRRQGVHEVLLTATALEVEEP
ncbi:MAG: hypothetical protein Q4C85_07085 [Actinomyces sp.]|uniref:hypothetical protein n=1 Tax=Actinomyces sp. TaxID=29317 RepID=UPI0026DD10C5|nr:hypothetical protein [Actinomyces sp.]MDO4243506.1 hypothetical protein [Actinomyces sp.]